MGVLFASLLAAAVLLVLSPAARGESIAVDRSPAGAPYIAGELVVTYEEGASERAVETLDEEAEVERIKEDLAQDPAVESVEYNFLGQLAYTPDDPKFRYQWGLKKPGFPDAWDRTPDSGADVAVVDTGADVGHVDLRQKIAQAKDIVNGDSTVRDLSGHGTHVAGIIAADTDNHKGIAGGCPNCKLLVAKVFDGKNTGTVARFAKGIEWSANHGAEVINLSFTHPL